MFTRPLCKPAAKKFFVLLLKDLKHNLDIGARILHVHRDVTHHAYLKEQLNSNGERYIRKHPQLKVKVVDGSSLAVAVVINSIPKGTSQVVLRGRLSKVVYYIAFALCQRGIQVVTLDEEDWLNQLGLDGSVKRLGQLGESTRFSTALFRWRVVASLNSDGEILAATDSYHRDLRFDMQ
ncbi:hypothetical protein RND71_007702 [Anisodus tanguticus]|uniref:Uncharacterized protein n=1 Tax=Anisodus tanguticus TaxID=243964 RepID=A0AAE1SMT8_9SOLA|nr:hypothetical protein RND71_007702 [Anisodus tanguticus]